MATNILQSQVSLGHQEDKKQCFNEIPDRFKCLQKIGEGTYGIVYKGFDTQTNTQVAIKKVKLDQEQEGIPQSALREICILKDLSDHQNIVKLRDVIYQIEESKLFLVFEYVDYDLKKYLETMKHLTQHDIKLIMYQLLNGLDFCHQRRIIHRDIKPQNILIDKAGNVKIADFGLAKTFQVPSKTLTHEVETLWYRPPEILLGVKTYSLAIDMWSIGCVFYELMEKKPLFISDSEIEAIFKIFQFHGTPNSETFQGLEDYPYFKSTFPRFHAQDPFIVFKNLENDARDLLMQMIALNPLDRISVKQALLHPYFDSLTESEKTAYNQYNTNQYMKFFSI
ncbi:cyclin-dependent kinase-like Serine/Threonine kinase family protein (macronuclear) [Tetrahymena thermophila SB210]|uniref:Cyclin-dependent kinase 2 homolog n=1 Tax=Tetrahymena thermophila (strain SB210) TaxID=312017 RepID=Q231R0_TETTS|nr:cyclin-dependent kinase-like Serine/Threonine kinase family protein [Tetrahymena thermophila SB210]EAR91242.1 cyclin-dependent kinase-like Serine/Threonine kinase family protein [Tetrahymena thermophila SB210]|eukprot:XP_001011487.1 cyclin-dependent kinase-like Serine/Threonine kinase family protein [Tetrahymena thermophila SB210]